MEIKFRYTLGIILTIVITGMWAITYTIVKLDTGAELIRKWQLEIIYEIKIKDYVTAERDAELALRIDRLKQKLSETEMNVDNNEKKLERLNKK